jgi:predicted DNA-binding transcriptional regulator AlpA
MQSKPTPDNDLQVIRPRQLAANLGVSTVTLWRMRQRRELPEPIVISSGAKGWRRAAIEEWLNAKKAGQ